VLAEKEQYFADLCLQSGLNQTSGDFAAGSLLHSAVPCQERYFLVDGDQWPHLGFAFGLALRTFSSQLRSFASFGRARSSYP
jgi:hypothetical protein